MRRFEDGVAGFIVDIRAGRDADAADLRGQRVGNVIAVQIHRRNDIVFFGARQNLLQEGVANHVFDNDFSGGNRLVLRLICRVAPLFGFHAVILRPGEDLFAEFPFGQRVAPGFEAAFREFHDVAFMHERHRFAVMCNRVADRRPHKAFRAFNRNRFDANGGCFGETDF